MTPLSDTVEPGKDRAATILIDLFGKLSTQGLLADEIMILIEHTIDVIGNGGSFTVASLNEHLKSLGWRGDLIDNTTFECIISFLMTGNCFEVEKHTPHQFCYNTSGVDRLARSI